MIINRAKKEIMKNKQGSVLLWTTMFVSLFFIIASTTTVLTISEIRQSAKIDSSTEAYLLAEAGAERANNYASAGMGTGGTKTGTIGGSTNTYTFQVVKAPAFYDNAKTCDALDTNNDGSINTDDANYCYYSQAIVGSIRRKIDGKKKDINLDQGKTIDLNNTSTVFNPTYGAAGLINLTPVSVPPSPETFTYSVNIEKITSLSGDTSVTGLADIGGLSTNKKAIRIFRERDKIWLGVGYLNSTSGVYAGLSATSNVSKSISTSVNDIRAILIYKKGSPDPRQNTITLRLIDVDTQSCLGFLVMSNSDDIEILGDMSPFYAFFSGSNVTIDRSMSTAKVRADRNVSSSAYYYKHLFFRVE